jgi:hypothetical protein
MGEVRFTVADAAKKLGMSAQGLRIAMQRGKFTYFGEAWKNDEKWSYYINKNRLEEYLGIKESNQKTSEEELNL